jgi:hypothetical protein
VTPRARQVERGACVAVGAFAFGAICLAVAGSFLDRADFILAAIGFLALEIAAAYAVERVKE